MIPPRHSFMKFSFRLLIALFAINMLQSQAQTASVESLRTARDLRQKLALSVSQNAETTAKALATLRSTRSTSGRSISADSDLAYASLDVGYRLLALERPDAAEEFFRAAEQAFEAEYSRRSLARDKAEVLQHLAVIRGRFLGKIDQAKADIAEAINLQPDDAALKEARSLLERGQSKNIKSGGKN